MMLSPRSKRILVIRPDEIGDVVLLSPFLRNLHRSVPNASITLVTNELCREMLCHCPHVNELHSLPFAPTLNETHIDFVLSEAEATKKLLALRGPFDLTLLPRADADYYGAEKVAHFLSNGSPILACAAEFITWSLPTPKPSGLTTATFHATVPQSEVLTNLDFLRWCGGTVEDEYLEFWDTESDLLSVYRSPEASLPVPKTIVFHPPGSRAALRRWPQGRSRNLVAEILARTPYAVVVVGGPQDEWVVDEFAGFLHPRLKMATGTFTLTQLGALIRLCGYFVGGDSGPMHIAAAVGAKTIGIFGPGSELRFGPWGCNSCVVSTRRSCTPDQKRTFEACCSLCCHATNLCMEDISADTVLSVMATHFA